jgi:FkbM family methyltransferase
MKNLFTYLKCLRNHTIWIKNLNSRSLVVDAGSHKGEFAQEVFARFRCRCVLIEANPDLADLSYVPPGGSLMNVALAASSGSASFVFRENPEKGGILPLFMDSYSPDVKIIRIQKITLENLLAEHALDRISLLKLDIEGAEFELLQTAPAECLMRVDQISVEFHDFMEEFQNKELFENVRSRLVKLGFVCCPMSFKTHGDVLFLNRQHSDLSQIESRLVSILGRWVCRLKGILVGKEFQQKP